MVADGLVSRITEVLKQVEYKDWKARLWVSGDAAYLQFQFSFTAVDAWTGRAAEQLTRRWVIEPEATAGEIVRTALLAVLTAEEHEAREQFTYRGKHVHGFHFKLD
jgi:hypothetical protein